MVELIGWIATLGTLISFTMNDMVRLRLIGGSFAILWIVYGFLKMDNPIIVINSCIVMIHLYWFYTNRKGLGAGGESLKEKFIDSSDSNNSVDGDSKSVDSDPITSGSWDDNKVHSEGDFMYNWIRKHSRK